MLLDLLKYSCFLSKCPVLGSLNSTAWRDHAQIPCPTLPFVWWGHPICISRLTFLWADAARSLQLCLTLCDPVDGSPPGSSIHGRISGILQARTLEWVAISFSNAWKWKVKVKSLSRVWLSDPMDHSLPGSSIHGTFQARVLEWASGPVLPVYFWIPFVTVSKMPWCYRQNLLFPLNLHSPPSCEPLQKPGRLVWTLCTLLIAYPNRSWVFPLHIWCLCYHFFIRWLQVSYHFHLVLLQSILHTNGRVKNVFLLRVDFFPDSNTCLRFKAKKSTQDKVCTLHLTLSHPVCLRGQTLHPKLSIPLVKNVFISQMRLLWDFLVVQWLGLCTSLQVAGELRSWMAPCAAKNK